MNHFKLINDNVDVKPIAREIAALENAWFQRTGRQERCQAQIETNAIPLRGLRRSKIMGRRRRDVNETRQTLMAKNFPQTLCLLEAFAAMLDGELSRAKLARLPPGAEVYPHIDRGEYYRQRDRYHLVIDSPFASTLIAEDETATLKTGELWWFDNKVLHSASNNTPSPRIHLVFDLKPKSYLNLDSSERSKIKDAGRLFGQLRNKSDLSGLIAVAEAVRLYEAIRSNPKSWKPVLEQYGCLVQAEKRPLIVLSKILWPDLAPKKRQRRVSAMGWALANIDMNRFGVSEVRKNLRKAGGIRAIHRDWTAAKEQLIYS
jgi:hypothetical protein